MGVVGLTKSTKDYHHLLQYLNVLFKVMGVGKDAYTTFIVAKNYEGGMSRDLRNHDGFWTVVLNVGDFEGGGKGISVATLRWNELLLKGDEKLVWSSQPGTAW